MHSSDCLGAVAVIFNPEDNPGLFEKDNSYILKRFELYGKNYMLISEGKKVSLITDLKEEELLSVILPEGTEDKISSLILKWYNNSLSLRVNAIQTNEDFYSGFT